MLKLVKYEFRKQMFSKLVIAIMLGVMAIIFLYFNYSGKQDAAAAMLTLMTTSMVFAMFYVALESIVVYEKDLSTKQSYMLFLVPQSSASILGAKMIAAVLQIIFTLVMAAGIIGGCLLLFFLKYEDMKQIFEALKAMIEVTINATIDWAYILDMAASFVLLWVFAVMLAIFITTILNTVLNKNKLISVLTIILYFVCFYLIGEFESFLFDRDISEIVKNILEYAYIIILDLGFFFGTAWLIDKKLSV